MRILTWNLRQANSNSLIWELIKLYKADILLLQEVINLPKYFLNNYYFVLKNAIKKDGSLQKFKTAILSRFEITEEIELKSKYKSINEQLKLNLGNYIYVKIKHKSNIINCVSLHSPAWPVNNDKLNFKDYLLIKLKNNSKIWLTELIYSALKEIFNINENWIIGGDFNSSETFDKEYQLKNKLDYGIVINGNREIIERMYSLGLLECLRETNKSIVPTYRNKNGKIIHQIDHLYVSKNIFNKLINCFTGDKKYIFDNNLSDHLPIITDFNL